MISLTTVATFLLVLLVGWFGKKLGAFLRRQAARLSQGALSQRAPEETAAAHR